MTNPEDTGWVNPHDGITYYEGDSIPAYLFDSSGALVYGEACVRLNDPGFMGVVWLNTKVGHEVVIPPRSVEEIIEWVILLLNLMRMCILLAESPGWRWC